MKGKNCNRQILQEIRFLLVELGLRLLRGVYTEQSECARNDDKTCKSFNEIYDFC
jgi:hypothetical protein